VPKSCACTPMQTIAKSVGAANFETIAISLESIARDWKPPMLGSRVLLEIVFKRVKSALPARIATGWRSGQGSLRQLIY
jgi:hypothetical protein